MTSPKIRQYLTFNMQNFYTKVTISHKIVAKNLKIWQSYSPVLLIFSISVPNLVTIGSHLMSFLDCVRRLTCKRPYFDISRVKRVSHAKV